MKWKAKFQIYYYNNDIIKRRMTKKNPRKESLEKNQLKYRNYKIIKTTLLLDIYYRRHTSYSYNYDYNYYGSNWNNNT